LQLVRQTQQSSWPRIPCCEGGDDILNSWIDPLLSRPLPNRTGPATVTDAARVSK
jgi:hypothetical protein